MKNGILLVNRLKWLIITNIWICGLHPDCHGGKPDNKVSQVKKAMLSLLRFVRKHKIGCDQAFYLFDHMVAPVLYYGAEIWGFETVECIENVQLYFCKKTPQYQHKCEQCSCLGRSG